jgi:hypothetical protein
MKAYKIFHGYGRSRVFENEVANWEEDLKVIVRE